MPFILRVH